MDEEAVTGVDAVMQAAAFFRTKNDHIAGLERAFLYGLAIAGLFFRGAGELDAVAGIDPPDKAGAIKTRARAGSAHGIAYTDLGSGGFDDLLTLSAFHHCRALVWRNKLFAGTAAEAERQKEQAERKRAGKTLHVYPFLRIVLIKQEKRGITDRVNGILFTSIAGNARLWQVFKI